MSLVLRPTLLATALGLTALTAGCQKPMATSAAVKPAVVDTAQIEQTLRTGEAQWNADYKAKDLARIAAHYAPQGVLMTPGAPVMSGTDALGMGMKELVADPAFHLELNTEKVGVAASGDLAYTRGAYTLTVTDPQTKTPTTQTGSYVTVYARQPDGTWKALEDIASPTTPPPLAKSN